MKLATQKHMSAIVVLAWLRGVTQRPIQMTVSILQPMAYEHATISSDDYL